MTDLRQMPDPKTFQFSLKTMLLVMTGCAIVLALWRAEAMVVAYELIPITAFCLARKDVRWRAAMVSMLFMVGMLVVYLAFRFGFSWENLGKAALMGLGLGVISIPFWLGPILLWGTVTKRGARTWNAERPGMEPEDGDMSPYQFSLKTLFLIMTGSAVAFFFIRQWGLPFLGLVYVIAPIAVFGFSPHHVRWRRTYNTMVLVIVGVALTAIVQAPDLRNEPTLFVIGFGIVMFPLWMLVISFWDHLTTPSSPVNDTDHDTEADSLANFGEE